MCSSDLKGWAQLPDDLGGGIKPLPNPASGTLAALKANEQLMRDLGARGTPVLIYRSADHVVHVTQRAPSVEELSAIAATAVFD